MFGGSEKHTLWVLSRPSRVVKENTVDLENIRESLETEKNRGIKCRHRNMVQQEGSKKPFSFSVLQFWKVTGHQSNGRTEDKHHPPGRMDGRKSTTWRRVSVHTNVDCSTLNGFRLLLQGRRRLQKMHG